MVLAPKSSLLFHHCWFHKFGELTRFDLKVNHNTSFIFLVNNIGIRLSLLTDMRLLQEWKSDLSQTNEITKDVS